MTELLTVVQVVLDPYSLTQAFWGQYGPSASKTRPAEHSPSGCEPPTICLSAVLVCSLIRAFGEQYGQLHMSASKTGSEHSPSGYLSSSICISSCAGLIQSNSGIPKAVQLE